MEITATCLNPECGNNGHPIRLEVDPESIPVAVVCGACETQIDNVYPALDSLT